MSITKVLALLALLFGLLLVMPASAQSDCYINAQGVKVCPLRSTVRSALNPAATVTVTKVVDRPSTQWVQSRPSVSYAPQPASYSQPVRAVVKNTSNRVFTGNGLLGGGGLFGGDGLFPRRKERSQARQANAQARYAASYQQPSQYVEYASPSYATPVRSYATTTSSGVCSVCGKVKPSNYASAKAYPSSVAYEGYGGGGSAETEEAAECLERAAKWIRSGEYEIASSNLRVAAELVTQIQGQNYERSTGSTEKKINKQPDNGDATDSKGSLFDFKRLQTDVEEEKPAVVASLPKVVTVKLPRIVVATLPRVDSRSRSRILVASL